MTDMLLEVEDLQVVFQGPDRRNTHAVDGVDFSVRRGRTLGIVGESGCGKSVSALALLGLLPRPAGRVTAGSDLHTPGLHRLNRTEYANAIRDLLDIEVDVARMLPGDGSSEGFDNIDADWAYVSTSSDEVDFSDIRPYDGAVNDYLAPQLDEDRLRRGQVAIAFNEDTEYNNYDIDRQRTGFSGSGSRYSTESAASSPSRESSPPPSAG